MGLIAELKRRNVFRVGIAYAALVWAVVEVTSTVAPAFGLPDWTFALVTWLGIIGFPFALLFAWAFELTPEGIKREHEVDRSASITDVTGRKIDFVIISLLFFVLIFLIWGRYTGEPGTAESGVPAPAENQTSTTKETADSGFSSIAVLPFDNMSGSADQEYFSDGISEELLNLLAKRPSLKVAARTSSFAFRDKAENITEIGRQLGVETVLEGSVRRSGTRLRITAQLIEAATGYHLWSETYDRELTDVFVVQDEISAAIVSALRVHLDTGSDISTRSRVTDIDAYASYLKGRHAIERREQAALYEAVMHFDAALALDPNYAPALSGKGEAYILLSENNYGDLSQIEAFSIAERAINRALDIDPTLAEAHASMGLLLNDSGRPADALEALNRAIEFSPNLAQAYHWRSSSYRQLGYPRRELDDLLGAYERNPLFQPTVITLFQNYYADGRHEEAAKIKSQYATHDDNDRVASKLRIFMLEEDGQLADAFKMLSEFEDTWPALRRDRALLSWQLMNPVHAFELNPNWLFQFWVSYPARDLAGMKRAIARADLDGNPFRRDLPELLQAVSYLIEGEPASLRRANQIVDALDHSIDGPLLGPEPENVNILFAIAIREAVGDTQGVQKLEGLLRDYVAEMERRGFSWRALRWPRLMLATVNGDVGEMARLLRSMLDTRDLIWAWFIDDIYFYAAYRELPELKALETEFLEYLNAERLKLGWEPLAGF